MINPSLFLFVNRSYSTRTYGTKEIKAKVNGIKTNSNITIGYLI